MEKIWSYIKKNYLEYKWVWIFTLLLFLSFAVFAGIYKLNITGKVFGLYHFSDKNSDWGNFGSYIGGVLNTLINGGVLIVLITTLLKQSIAIKEARESNLGPMIHFQLNEIFNRLSEWESKGDFRTLYNTKRFIRTKKNRKARDIEKFLGHGDPDGRELSLMIEEFGDKILALYDDLFDMHELLMQAEKLKCINQPLIELFKRRRAVMKAFIALTDCQFDKAETFTEFGWPDCSADFNEMVNYFGFDIKEYRDGKDTDIAKPDKTSDPS